MPEMSGKCKLNPTKIRRTSRATSKKFTPPTESFFFKIETPILLVNLQGVPQNILVDE